MPSFTLNWQKAQHKINKNNHCFMVIIMDSVNLSYISLNNKSIGLPD